MTREAVYMGIPGTPNVVSAIDDRGVHKFEGELAWGAPSARAHNLSVQLLTHLLGDGGRARRIARRFLWRTLVEWEAGKPWRKTAGELRSVVDAIDKVETEAAGMRRQMQIEVPRILAEPIIGPGGVPMEWTNELKVRG